jgi:alpha-1,2-mannosyltransferase
VGLRVAGLVYALSAAVCCVLAATGRAHLVDLHVYRMGGEAALHGASLYRLRFSGLPFTYPPFAALLFALLAMLPWAMAAGLLTVASAAAFPVMLYLALRLGSSGAGSQAAWRVAFAAGAAAIWLEPARTALGYGQVDILIATAVLYDLALPDTARRKGLAIGLAAGLKLTPAIFVGYLVITRRYRAAATATLTFAGTIAAGFAVFPGSSAWYWAGTFARPGHVSPVEDAENQSLLGALARTMHTENVLAVWLPLAVAVAVAGLALAAAASRRGDEALGFSLCAVTGLLVSPISWTHHWVIAIPALLLAGVAVYRAYQDRRGATAVLGAAGIMTIAVIGWARLARDVPSSGWLGLSGTALAESVAYVLLGLFVLGLAAVRTRRAIVRGACLPGPAGERSEAECLRPGSA